MAGKRIDQALVTIGRAETLDEALRMIRDGRVFLGINRVDDPKLMVRDVNRIVVRAEEYRYVSRGAYKLKRAVERFCIDLRDRVCMDVGSSTGGFTEVMLLKGAKKVYSIDVGYGLLDWKLRSDARVSVMERVNARFLEAEAFDPRPDFGATDVSFISLKAVLPSALAVLTDDARFVALIKPQFEARREQVGAKGVVRDREVHFEVVRDIVGFVATLGWSVQDVSYSPIRGPEGNIEFLANITRTNGCSVNECKIFEMIADAYDFFMKNDE